MDGSNYKRDSGKLLISGYPLMVLPLLAEKIGLNEAIVLQQVHYWIENPLNKNIKEDRVWVYNTYDEWKKQFPFWSYDTIKVIILSLQNKKLLLTGFFNKVARDRTKWYTIDYDAVECLDIGTSAEIPLLHQRKSRYCISGISADVLPETTTKISTDIKNNNKKSFDSEFEEFWNTYPKKVDKHKCNKIYNTLLVSGGIILHKEILNSLSGQLREREVNEEVGEWNPPQKNPSTWLNGRCWANQFKTEGEVREEHRRSVNKLSRQPGRMSKTEQYHDINARVREAAARRVEAIEREREALEREIRNCEDSD